MKITKSKDLFVGIALLICWIIYSIFFQRFYQDIVEFSSDGAQPIVQILEIFEYRGRELLPFLLLYFLLTSLSFLFLIYSFKRDFNKNKLNIIIFSFLFIGLIGINLYNRLSILLTVLVVVSLVIMYSVVITVNYLYLEEVKYEKGDVLHTEGPFKEKVEAEKYSTMIIEKKQSYFDKQNFLLKSDIYQNESNNFYVDIYLEN